MVIKEHGLASVPTPVRRNPLPMGYVKGYLDLYAYNLRVHGIRTVVDAYKKPSDSKLDFWEEVKRECDKVHGQRLSVIERGTKSFKCGYIYRRSNDGIVFVLHTPEFKATYSLDEHYANDRRLLDEIGYVRAPS